MRQMLQIMYKQTDESTCNMTCYFSKLQERRIALYRQKTFYEISTCRQYSLKLKKIKPSEWLTFCASYLQHYITVYALGINQAIYANVSWILHACTDACQC